MEIRPYKPEDLPEMTAVWNEVVDAANAFPQTDPLSPEEAARFFAEQSRTAVAVLECKVVGLYILHPNNIGRCSHIANASYAVKSSCRGMQAGEALVRDCIDAAGKLDLFDHLIGSMVKFLLGGINAEQVNNEGQQQDSDEDKDHRTEIVGLAPLVVQLPPGFLKENRNHHLY